MSRCKLTIQDEEQRRVVLLNQWVVEIGRVVPCDLILSASGVDDHHCRLLRTHAGYVLQDLGGDSGTKVNGERVRLHTLVTGDEISIGSATIQYDSAIDDHRALAVTDEQNPSLTYQLDFVGQSSVVESVFTPADQEEGGRSAGLKIDLLYNWIRRCSELGEEDELLDMSARILCELPSVHRAEVLFYNEKTGTVQCEASVTPAGSEPRPAADVPSEIVRRVLQKGEAVLSDHQISAPMRNNTAVFAMISVESAGGSRPFNKEDLQFLVSFARLLEREIERQRNHRRVMDENRLLRETVSGELSVIGESPPMKILFDQIERAASSNTTILIQGESGTGKELVARALHRLSPRKSEAFISVNCAVLQEDLLASDLFGHLKGAFTGATADRAGKFEMADGGTLFFDEIGELPMPLQAKLLRALQEGEIERVGGGEAHIVDVRVIAATNRKLEDDVRTGTFRKDLYFRLQVVELVVPPLREREGDVSRLLDYFLELFARQEGRARLRLTAEIREALEGYEWPGNVRELRNLVERWVVMNREGRVMGDDLPGAIRDSIATIGKPGSSVLSLKEVEEAHIRAVLKISKGNKSKASRLLGIDRSTLYDRIDRYNIDV